MQLKVELRQDAERGWIAEIPALPGIKTYGPDRAKVLADVQALALRWFAGQHQEGKSESELLSLSFHIAKEYQLGVLLVHGIGSQPSGETLVHWGDVMLKTIGSATCHKVRTKVELAGPDQSGASEERAEAVIRLQADNSEERWLLSEGWWADAFHAPSFHELVIWSLRALPWSIALHFKHKYLKASEQNKPFQKVLLTVFVIAQLLMALVLTPVFLLLLILTLILGLLPIPQLRSFILSTQGVLAATVGDSLAFVESPVRAALIRTRVLNGLKRLQQRCEHTILIAHSQGAAVVLDALGGIMEPSQEEGQSALPDAQTPDVMPDTLLTFGAGTNQLASLKTLSAGLPGNNPTLMAIFALLATTALSAWFYIDILAHRIDFSKIFLTLMLLFLYMIIFGIMGLLIPRLISFLSKWWHALQKNLDKIKVWTTVVFVLAAMIPLLIYADRKDLPLLQVSVTFLAIIILLGAISNILSKEKKAEAATVRKPPGLDRWIDIYASSDPVPNGPTRTNQAGESQSIQVWNLESAFADHTSYWNNLDGFVLRILKACAETAKSSWLTELPSITPGMDKRSSWRVGWLWMARLAIGIMWFLTGISIWIKYGNELPMPFELPDWLPETTVRFTILIGIIALVCWASFGLLHLIWQRWVDKEQETMLAHQWPESNGGNYLVSIGMLFWTIFFLALLIMRSELTISFPNFRDLFSGASSIFGIAIISTWVLLKLRPPPESDIANPLSSEDGADS